ncbi:MAG: 2OG-Fe(II) oxygenase [Janthinobacterium lividum]
MKSAASGDTLDHRAALGDPAAQVDLAAVLDARGHHAAAIDWLARAARADHPPALRLLGIRLSTGLNAPGLPLEGADLIRRAAGLGDGKALALLAVFAGTGYLQPQDLALALDFGRKAAARGWTPARDQLALLSAGPDGQAAGVDVDLAVWRRPPPGEIRSARPRVTSFPNLLPAAVCDALIERSRSRLVRAEVIDPTSGRPIVEKTRTNRLATISLFDSDLLSIVVQERLAAAASVPTTTLEAMSVLNYLPGEQSRPHFDFIDPQAPSYGAEITQLGQRVATILVYLNDSYKGGETSFPELGIDHRGKRGDALLFFNVDATGAPDRRTVHAGRPPLSGQKWVVSQFIRSRPRT